MAQYSGRGHERRNEIARAKGFRNYAEYRKATPAQQQAATARLARSSAAYARTGAAAQAATTAGGRRRHLPAIDLGAAGQAIVSGRDRELRSFVRRAEREGDRVKGHFIIRDENGRTREVNIWSKGGVDPSWLLAAADGFGRMADVIVDQVAQVYGLEGAWKLIEIQLVAA